MREIRAQTLGLVCCVCADDAEVVYVEHCPRFLGTGRLADASQRFHPNKLDTLRLRFPERERIFPG